MIEEQVKFEKWKSKVEVYLEQMVKKSSGSFRYDFFTDFQNNVPPNVSATRAIKRGYKGVTNGSSIRGKTKW
jgi:hypothetical protein